MEVLSWKRIVFKILRILEVFVSLILEKHFDNIMALDLEMNKMIVSLQADEKNRRKQALEELVRNMSQERLSNNLDEMIKVWDSVHRLVVRILNDNTEICRELAVEILRIFLEYLPPEDKHINYVIPIISRRLGSQELIESSEEVRLNCVSLLRTIISRYRDLLAPYIQDVTGILARTVTDKYPNVKKESCKCISDYAKTLTGHFYSQSEHLIKPILSNFTHQHYRVRLGAVQAIGDVMRYGNSKSMEEVATPLAQRLFDQSGIVRQAVVEVAGHWLVELPDRYSWWHKLLPLILTGLHDELAEIRARAADMWDAAGKLYMEENENDEKLKDKMDFLTEDPEHYPPEGKYLRKRAQQFVRDLENVIARSQSSVSRPNLGCREIAQRNLSVLVKGVSTELGDWLPDIRVRSAQLLCVLILNAEESITQHIEKFLPSMYRACNDEDKRVVGCVETAARYLGYFVEPKVYCHLVIPTLEESPTAGHLHVFAAILSGSERNALSLELNKIANFLQQPCICQSKKSKYQRQILSCCNSILVVCKEDCAAVTQALFSIIFTVYAMSNESNIREEADRLLQVLVDVNNSLRDVEDLFCNCVRQLIMSIHDDCDSWSVYNAESQIFCACLSHAGTAAARSMDLVIPVLKRTVSKDADSELKLRHLILLSEYFLNNQDLHRYVENPHKFVSTVIEELIVPGLIWAAGRAAEAIRTAAVCCLCAVLQNKIIKPNDENVADDTANDSATRGNEKSEISINVEQFLSVFDTVVPVLVSLVDDNAKKTRLYSMRAICSLITIGRQLSCLSDEHVNRAYPVILKRLDDGCDEIRSAAVEALVNVWNAAPENYDIVFSRSHIDALYTTMIIHLDDPESHFQEIMLDALKCVAKIHPELLRDKLQNSRPNFRNKTGVDKLLDHCQSVLQNS